MQKTKIYFIAIIGMMMVVTGCKAPVINTLKPADIKVEILYQEYDATIGKDVIGMQMVDKYYFDNIDRIKSIKLNGSNVSITFAQTQRVQFVLNGVSNIIEIDDLILNYKSGNNLYVYRFVPEELLFRAQ